LENAGVITEMVAQCIALKLFLSHTFVSSWKERKEIAGLPFGISHNCHKVQSIDRPCSSQLAKTPSSASCEYERKNEDKEDEIGFAVNSQTA
jgi:hypothetical protein